jgi:hypothetical protein
MSDLDAAVAAYVAYWEGLSPETVARLDDLAVEGFRFVDPFQDITGRERAKRAFAATFDATDEPRFRVTDRATSGRTAYLRWTFTFRPKGRAAVWTIEGMSEVAFGADGRALSHIDHWDAGGQFYARLPVLGTLIRLVKRRLAH